MADGRIFIVGQTAEIYFREPGHGANRNLIFHGVF